MDDDVIRIRPAELRQEQEEPSVPKVGTGILKGLEALFPGTERSFRNWQQRVGPLAREATDILTSPLTPTDIALGMQSGIGKPVAPKNARQLGYIPSLKLKDGTVVKGKIGQQHFDIAEDKGIPWEAIEDKGFQHPEKPDVWMAKGEAPESLNPVDEKSRLETMPKPDAVKHVKNLSDEGLQHMTDANGIRFTSREQAETDLLKPLMQTSPRQKFDIEDLTKEIPKIHGGPVPTWTEKMSAELRASSEDLQESFDHFKEDFSDAMARYKSEPRRIGPPAVEMRNGNIVTGWTNETTAALIKRKGLNTNDILRRGQIRPIKPGKSEFLPITGLYAGSDWQNILRSHIGNLQIAGLNSAKFAKTIMKNVPSDLHREALLNYIEANGDLEKLGKWHLESLRNPKTKQYAQGYRAAMRLPQQLKDFAKEVRKYYDAKAGALEELGMLTQFVEDYIPHIQKSPYSNVARAIRGEANVSGSRYVLNRPFFTRERIFDYYFDSEQAGVKPVKKDIAHDLVKYDMAFHKAVETRNFIKTLTEGIASDGKPLVHVAGDIHEVPKDEPVKSATLINPKGRPEEYAWYKRPPDNAAFRKWKWVGEKDNHGVFMQGDMYIHPEIAKDLNKLFTPSGVREWAPSRALLKLESNFKGIIVSMSGFHQTHVGSHAAFHGVNPFNAPPLDWNDPLTKSLIRSGLMVHDWSGSHLFHEGLAGGGLITKTPVLGPYIAKYTDYLFSDYIPRIKVQMAKKAFDRNLGRYSKTMSRKEIMNITADQANAAFGELNHAVLGKSKTMQDLLQLCFFAPDFLEARGRFATQALRPYGKKIETSLGTLPTMFGFLDNEQFMAAAIRAGLGLFGGARILNAILNGGNPRWDHPFTVKAGKYEISMRSVPGDIYHMLSDPQGFAYVRLSPAVIRPAIEWAQGRTRSGKSVETDQLLKDVMKGAVPITLSPQFKEGAKWWMSALSVLGVTAYESRTAFEQAAILQRSKRSVFTPRVEDAERQKIVRRFSKELKDAKTPEEKKDIRDRILAEGRAKNIFTSDYKKIQQKAVVDDIEPTIKAMELRDLMDIWPKTNKAEKQKYMPILAKKLMNYAKTHPGELGEFKDKFDEVKKMLKVQDKATHPDKPIRIIED